ncbi:hypothetical protein V8C86DRAFT_3034869 [Haematococcus lacustris]
MQKLESSKRAKRGGWAMWAGEEEATGFQGTSSPALLHTRAQVQGVQARRRVQVGARIEENGANPTLVATPLWLSSSQQVTLVHIIIGSSTSCKGVIAKQIMDVMGLNPSSANRRLLQLKDQGLGYKVFTDRHVLNQLQQLGLASPLTHQELASLPMCMCSSPVNSGLDDWGDYVHNESEGAGAEARVASGNWEEEEINVDNEEEEGDGYNDDEEEGEDDEEEGEDDDEDEDWELPTSLPSERVVKQSLPKADRDRLLSSPRARYPNLKLTTCLKVELDALQLLATKPEADILRSKMGWLGPLSLVTWKRYKGQLLRWLAFLQLLAPDAQPLTLHSYVQDHSTFLLYLAFLKMRGDSSGVETGKHLQLASCVSMWLALTNPTQPWSSWVQSHLVPHYTRLYQAITKLGTHRRAVLQTQALLSPVEQPHAEILLQWQEQFKDNALQQLSKHQAWEALPVEVAHLNLAKWWKRLHTVTKATWSFVPLHELRNVFITHRLDHPEVPGPSTEASAHVMLNSPTTWHAHYDRNKKQRLALEAQANMPLYRQALLQGGAGKSKGPAQQKSWGEEGGAAYDDEA